MGTEYYMYVAKDEFEKCLVPFGKFKCTHHEKYGQALEFDDETFAKLIANPEDNKKMFIIKRYNPSFEYGKTYEILIDDTLRTSFYIKFEGYIIAMSGIYGWYMDEDNDVYMDHEVGMVHMELKTTHHSECGIDVPAYWIPLGKGSKSDKAIELHYTGTLEIIHLYDENGNVYID